MDRYAVIGQPIDHSLSPDIHRAFAAQTGERLCYGRLSAAADGFAAAAQAFFQAGGCGLNVTSPFKGDAYHWVNRADAKASSCAAVNTISLNAGETVGYNTDGFGLLQDLRVQRVPVAGQRLLIIGAGGAVRGILGALLDAGAAAVHIANRTAAKAEALAADRPGWVKASALEDIQGGYDLIINGASAGFASQVVRIDPRLARDAACYDLLYSRDGQTPFCRWAAKAGAAWVSDGLGMLVEQAAASFAIWRGRRPQTRAVLRGLRMGWTN